MLKKFKLMRSKSAFTLVELLVVIAIIALLVSIVVPAISGALFKGKMTAALANGRGIQQAIFSKDTESIYTTSSATWPQAIQAWSDSSSFLNSLVTNDVLNVGYNFFTGPGLRTAANETEFLSPPGGVADINCMWSVVEDVTDGTQEGLPVLFSRNLTITDMANETYAPSATGKSTFLLPTENPFNDKGFIFITKSGAGYALFKNDLEVGTATQPGPYRTLFNVFELDGVTAVPNGVLRPAADTY